MEIILLRIRVANAIRKLRPNLPLPASAPEPAENLPIPWWRR